MPCIKVITNCDIPEQKEELLKADFAKAIELIPGKSEQWLMCVFDANKTIYFKGKNDKAAFVEVGIYGQPDSANCDKLTAKLTDILSSKLEIKPDRIYVKYAFTDEWGWNGRNF